MQPVTPRFLANLPTAQWAPSAQWSYDGGKSWEPVTLHAYSVTNSSTQQVRYTCTATISGLDSTRRRFSAFASRLRLWQTMVYGPGDTETIPRGTYWVTSLRRDPTPPHRDGHPDTEPTWQVAGSSAEWALGAAGSSRARFLAPRSLPRDTLKHALEGLIHDALPDALVSIDPDVDAYQVVPRMIEKRDRWGLISGRSDSPSIAKAAGAVVHADARGVLRVSKPATFDTAPVWHVTAGEDGVMVELAHEVDVSAVRNVVSVRGVNDEGKTTVGPVTLGDVDPDSPTWIGYGKAPLFYASPALETLPQCTAAAKSMLAEHLGYKSTLTLTTAYNPALEAGDVIAVDMPDGTVAHHIVDEVPDDGAGSPMQLTTRSYAGGLVGAPVALVEPEDVEDGYGLDESVGGDEDAA